MEPIQLKLARTALGLTVRDLGALGGVAPSTITRFEGGERDMLSRSRDRLQKLLEDRGIVFIPADASGGLGVRFKT